MEDGRFKLHFGREKRIFRRKGQKGAEETTCRKNIPSAQSPKEQQWRGPGSRPAHDKESIQRAPCNRRVFPCAASLIHPRFASMLLLLTSVEFALIANHEHDLPLEYIAVHQPAAYPRYVLIGLHLLQLATEQAGRC